MVWVVEKKVFYHYLDIGIEAVTVPVRVKFEFDVQAGALVVGTLSKDILYNKEALRERYPSLRHDVLEDAISRTVDDGISGYLRESGYIERPRKPSS